MNITIEELKYRIYNVYPVGKFELDKLLSVMDIRWDKNIPTAAVKTGMPPVMVFNQDFIEKECKSDEHLLMVLMHELYHIILGHTRLFNRITTAQNIAFDAIINSMICKIMQEPEYTSFFSGFYSDKGISALLRPPLNWTIDNYESKWKLKGELLNIHKALYTDEGDVTYVDIYNAITKTIIPKEGIPLIGNHGSSENEINQFDGAIPKYIDDESDEIDSETKKIIVEIVGKWPAVDPRKGRDEGIGSVEELFTAVNGNKRVSSVIKTALEKVVNSATGSIRLNKYRPTESLLPYPTIPDRKASVLSILGQSPIFFKGNIIKSTPTHVGKVHIYLDVSGSMEEYLEVIFGSLIPLRQYLHPIVHCFSTEVHDHSIKEVLSGRYKSTFGTHIDCVLKHIEQKKINKAMVITDGYVGEPSEHLLNKLPEKFLASVALTDPFYSDEIKLFSKNLFEIHYKENRYAA
jgi:hypothetical protein|tara:strand:+ start:4720 stop:6108 length:1389 start_codon:yes stop_codon:yes gene_type:complete